MTKVLNIAGHGGSGKSILALNLALALGQKGKDTILVDGNIYSPDVANYCNLSPSTYLNEYLNGERQIDETITYHPSGMKMVASMPEDIYDEEKHKEINRALLNLIGKAELLIVDSFSHNPAMYSAIDQADETIFVTNDDYGSIMKSKEFIRKMEEKGISVIGIVLNKKRKSTDARTVEFLTGKKVLAQVPYDKHIIESINNKQPLILTNPNNPFVKSLNELIELLK